MDLSGLSPGTTFYPCGVQARRVHRIQPAGRGEESVELLDRVAPEWTFLRSEAGFGLPARWTVASPARVERGAARRRVSWVL